MIISRTPLRISFAGGGSDLHSFYKYQPGAVISTAINKYIYIALNKQFDGRITVNYSKTEIVNKVSDVKNNLVRESLKYTKIHKGIHVTSVADIPSEGTGMGSSSAYLVGLLNALYAYKGKFVNAKRLAQEACHIEIRVLKKPIGKQDQYIASYGGFQYIQFNPNGSVFIDPIICKPRTQKILENRLLLFYTGITRSADPILTLQKQSMTTEKKRTIMSKMVEIAKKMRSDLNNNNLENFGEMLHQNWILKKQMAHGISNPKIDEWYTIALRNGAIGGKLLGAGGGGFLLFYAPEDKHKKIIKALSGLIHQDLRFEPQGSKIIFID